jgi:GNAT superfamily N-acetyltransferase
MTDDLRYREATSSDVPAMASCRAGDRAAGPADERIAAYLEGKHHPRQALAPRTAFVALAEGEVVGYIAGHATTRHGCAGEVQYLYVAPAFRRRGVATTLLHCLAAWFKDCGIRRACVNVDVKSAEAAPFYQRLGAVPLNRHWYIWEDIGRLVANLERGVDSMRAPHANEPCI